MRKLTAIALSSLLAFPLVAGPGDPSQEHARAAHALNRLAFGARPGEVDRVAALGVDRWIEQQLHPEQIPDAAVERRLAGYETLTWSNAAIMKQVYQPLREARRAAKQKGQGQDDEAQKKNPRDPATRELRRDAQRVMGELVSQRIVRAAESERQLNEVMVDFWMNHFNVFAGKGPDRFLLTAYERDTIRPHIWGRFEDLLMASAKSPAMLFYLDNARSVAAPENRSGRAKSVKRGGLNENYAREIMELHTLGVDGGYSQTDVTELARALTGWSIARPAEGSGFVFRRAMHDGGAKTILGVRLPAGGGMEEGERMIRILAAHPSTARHIAYQLAQRFVADVPPPALVDRVARRFTATHGDLRETVKAVITSPEFSDARYAGAKMKSPFEYAISAVRSVGATIENPLPLARQLKEMGQPLYFAQPPTGYGDDAETWSNSGALVQRINFAVALAGNQLPGVHVPLAGAAAEKAALTLGSPEFQRQ
jgi:uncharacterized protein (DUF1800 family)